MEILLRVAVEPHGPGVKIDQALPVQLSLGNDSLVSKPERGESTVPCGERVMQYGTFGCQQQPHLPRTPIEDPEKRLREGRCQTGAGSGIYREEGKKRKRTS